MESSNENLSCNTFVIFNYNIEKLQTMSASPNIRLNKMAIISRSDEI